MAEILIAIATLCMMPNGRATLEVTAGVQLECQKDYIRCLMAGKSTANNANKLMECVLKREVN